MRYVKFELAPGITAFRILNDAFERFENFWPIPRGTSYNFYLVRGSEGTALIDGADERVSDPFWDALESEVDPAEITHVVAQHVEPDHSGTLARVLERAPGAALLGTKRALEIGEKLAGLPSGRFREVGDGDSVDLGGRTLRFVAAPFVHWPETMMTHLPEEGVLFTCDLFGSHGASEAEFYDEDPESFELRDYYASILGIYPAMVGRAVSRVRELGPRILAPSHGALHREVGEILDLYERWASWRPLARALVVVGSQYGRTEALARAAAGGLAEGGLEVTVADSASWDPDDLLAETLDAAALLIATSTHNGRPFLGITFYLDLLEEYRPKNKVAAVVGVHGWAGGGVRVARERLESAGLPVVASLEVRGSPSEGELAEAGELGRRLAAEARERFLR